MKTVQLPSSFATLNCDLLKNSLLKSVRSFVEIQLLKASLRRERRQLLELTDRQLLDMGITRGEAIKESQKTGLPKHRLKNFKPSGLEDAPTIEVEF